MKFRSPPAPNAAAVSRPTDAVISVSPSTEKTTVPAADARPLDATRKLLRSAADQHQYQSAIGYGQQLFDSGQAGPNDLVAMAQTYSSIGDCPNALTWVDRANSAFHAAGGEPDESLRRIKSRCESFTRDRPIEIRPEQRERMMRMLAIFKERADVDRKNLPQLEADAEASKSGDPDVRLGQLYFGFGDYDRAIAALQRGLDKGQVTHLEDAYVYLGRSQVAVGNVVDARKTFVKLKTVPNISPRVLLLWELYADTLSGHR